jgi:hypothetical protein
MAAFGREHESSFTPASKLPFGISSLSATAALCGITLRVQSANYRHSGVAKRNPESSVFVQPALDSGLRRNDGNGSGVRIRRPEKLRFDLLI